METTVRENIERIRERIGRAAARAGRDPSGIALMAVSKTVGIDQVLEAYESGIRLFGENRIQEAQEKAPRLPADAELQLIGHLQRNKARAAAELFSTVQSIDRAQTASALSRYVVERGSQLSVLIEVNTSQEESKYGVRNEDEFFSILEEVRFLPGLVIRGLMTIAPFTENSEAVRASFRRLRELRDKAVSKYPDKDFSVLSMGMSSDFEIAIEEGSTMVRIGTSIFGARAQVER